LDLNIQKDPQGFLITLANANSKEARLQFAQSVKEKGHTYTQKLRNVRGDEIKEIKSMSGLSEDYLYQAEEEVHSMYLESNKEIENAISAKLASVGL
jgi:ribosome recycling factor